MHCASFPRIMYEYKVRIEATSLIHSILPVKSFFAAFKAGVGQYVQGGFHSRNCQCFFLGWQRQTGLAYCPCGYNES
jgi:hypothetical protein